MIILCNNINCWNNNTFLIIKRSKFTSGMIFLKIFFIFSKIYNKYVYTCVRMDT